MARARTDQSTPSRTKANQNPEQPIDSLSHSQTKSSENSQSIQGFKLSLYMSKDNSHSMGRGSERVKERAFRGETMSHPSNVAVGRPRLENGERLSDVDGGNLGIGRFFISLGDPWQKSQ